MANLIDTIQAEGTLTTLLESIKVNGATITRANVRADNGIVHVIDKVLVPLFMVV